MVMMASICTSYYNIILTWNIYYLVKSFTKSVPWGSCGHYWNTELCLDSGISADNSTFVADSGIMPNNSSFVAGSNDFDYMTSNTTLIADQNLTSPSNETVDWNSPANEFWRYVTTPIIIK